MKRKEIHRTTVPINNPIVLLPSTIASTTLKKLKIIQEVAHSN